MLTGKIFVGYVLLAWLLLGALSRHATLRALAFAALNALCFKLMLTELYGLHGHGVSFYFAVILAQYSLLRVAGTRRSFWLPMLFPVVIMIGTKSHAGWALIGMSYLAFRLSYMALEIKDGAIAMPSFAAYLSFACFPPLLAVGPITSMKVFADSLAAMRPWCWPSSAALLRIAVGALKLLVFSALFDTLIPIHLLGDFHRHGLIDLFISAIAYYAYLYCNFSGYTDIVIGMASVLGIRLEENFAQPYFARNLQEFWQRWHITLARYMRDMLYFPLVKQLTRRWGRARYNLAVVVAISVTFTLTGLWHGFALNFLYYGMIHAVGLVTHFLYTNALKKRLGPRMAVYQSNRVIAAAATLLTFSYVCFSLFFFADNLRQMALLAQAFH